MKILVLGATGSVGKHLVAQALEAGYEVRALVRDAARAPAAKGLEVVPGDALQAADVEAALAGCEAVIYSLGAPAGKATTLFSETTRVLIAAMRKAGVQRLIAITGIGAGDSKGHGGWFYEWFIFPLFTSKLYADKDVQEKLIRESGLDWTIVRPASFTDGPRGGALRATDVLEGVTIRKISRADVAAFVLEELRTGRWRGRTPLVGY
jgi:putative NADH-flavin reductase